MAQESLTPSVRLYQLSGSSWKWVDKGTSTTWWGQAAFGGSNGMEISFTPTKTTTSSFQIIIPSCVTGSAQYVTFQYRVTNSQKSTAPSAVTGNIASGSVRWWQESQTYTENCNITINVSGISPNTKYYVYIFANDVNSGSSGYAGNDPNYTGKIKCYNNYSTATTTIYYAYLQYNLNGGTGVQSYDEYSSTSSSTFYVNVTSTEPTKTGYTFKGWTTSATSTTVAYDPGDSITLYGATGNGTTTNLYAIWEENAVTYTYDCYDITNSNWINSFVYETETTATSITHPTIAGYKYEGYSVGTDWSAPGVQYTEQTCTKHSASKPIITFYYTETPTITSWQTPVRIVSISGSSYTTYSTTSTVNKYNAGYVKYTTPSYAGKVVFQTTSGSTSPDYYSYLSTSTLSAGSGTSRSGAVTGAITSDDDGASGSGNYDTLISYECNASTNYYWYVNAAWASSGTYNIPWKLNYYRKYTITYNANNGTGAPSSQSFYADNTTVTISSTIPTRTNYTFLGWSTNASATSATYAAGSSPTLSSQNYTLYAIWEASTYSVTITYNANGGIGAPSASIGSGNVGSNINIQISSTKPTKDRHIFKGWADGNSTTVSYQPGQTYPFSSNKTLYAVWENKFGADNVYYGINGEWKLCEVYYGSNGEWIPLKIYYGHSGIWKNNT